MESAHSHDANAHKHHSHGDDEGDSASEEEIHDEEAGGALGAHVHGHAHFALAVDESTIALELTAPAESVVGFENNPSSEEHKTAWLSFEKKWKEENSKFISFDSSLKCSLASAKAILEVEGEHAEVRAESTYNCAKAPTKSKFDLGLITELPKIKKLEVEVLPNESASYVKTIEFKDDKRVIPHLTF